MKVRAKVTFSIPKKYSSFSHPFSETVSIQIDSGTEVEADLFEIYHGPFYIFQVNGVAVEIMEEAFNDLFEKITA